MTDAQDDEPRGLWMESASERHRQQYMTLTEVIGTAGLGLSGFEFDRCASRLLWLL